jgi:hypothetical protein
MTAAWVGVVGALVGAIVGALLTQYLQRRNVAYARLHESRIDAYQDFIGAMMEFRKALTDRWFAEQLNAGYPVDSAAVYATRSTAWSAYYRVELLAGDDDIVTLARDARDRTAAIKNAPDNAAMNGQADLSRTSVGAFATAARQQVAGQ